MSLIFVCESINREKKEEYNNQYDLENQKLITTGPGNQAAGAQGNNDISSKQEKFAEFLRTEKLKRYKRIPRVFGCRNPVQIKCPNCNRERTTKTRLETTGT